MRKGELIVPFLSGEARWSIEESQNYNLKIKGGVFSELLL